MKEAQWQKILRKNTRRNKAALRNKRAVLELPDLNEIEEQYNIKVKGVRYA